MPSIQLSSLLVFFPFRSRSVEKIETLPYFQNTQMCLLYTLSTCIYKSRFCTLRLKDCYWNLPPSSPSSSSSTRAFPCSQLFQPKRRGSSAGDGQKGKKSYFAKESFLQKGYKVIHEFDMFFFSSVDIHKSPPGLGPGPSLARFK